VAAVLREHIRAWLNFGYLACCRLGISACDDNTRHTQFHFRAWPTFGCMLLTVLLSGCGESAPPAAEARTDERTVMIDGKPYREWTFLDRTIRVPASEKVFTPSTGPSWPVQLPDMVRKARPRESGESTTILTVRLLENRPRIGSTSLQEFVSEERFNEPPTETRPEWGLAFHKAELAKPEAEGYGYWVPLDPAIRSPDGKPPVFLCTPHFLDVDKLPDALYCHFEGTVSDQIHFQALFRGNALPTWQTVHDTAWRFVADRVTKTTKDEP
jgi:hypothetical protein